MPKFERHNKDNTHMHTYIIGYYTALRNIYEINLSESLYIMNVMIIQ